MFQRESSTVMQDVRALLGSGAAGSASDAQLLERFHDRYGEPEAEVAFAVLVARHGPMVLGVCRRALRDPDDVADAFQATFLVLVRKAGSVRVEDSLGRWLYGVSRRVAAKSRAERMRRAAREKGEPGGEPMGADRQGDAERRELIAVIDEEVERLPVPYRAAVVLCDLGGLTHEAAAWQLGCPVGTVESRLSRGRKRLRERLTRRGLAPMVGGFEGLVARSVPESLCRSTVEAALRIATVSAPTSILVEAAIKELAMKKMMTMALGFGAIALACGVGIAIAPRAKAEDDRPERLARSTAVAEPPAEASPVRLQDPARVKPGDTLTVEVLEALPGRPISGERFVRPDGTISLGFYGDLQVAGLNRKEIKVKLIEHLLQFITPDYLGLEIIDGVSKTVLKKVAPADSDRVFVDDTLIYTTPPRAPVASVAGPPKVKPGDRLLIEVLQPLPGRPISGVRFVRPDGTISLGFYGDLQVAGLDRKQIKEIIISHLREFVSDEDLGLTREDPRTGKQVEIAAADSASVFVDESLNLDMAVRQRSSGRTGEKLDRILQAIDELKAPDAAPGRPDRDPAQRLGDHDRRLGVIEAKLDRLVEAIEKLKE